jgi:hypothetical protein
VFPTLPVATPSTRGFRLWLPGSSQHTGVSHTLLKISGGSGDFLRDVLRDLSESELLIAAS